MSRERVSCFLAFAVVLIAIAPVGVRAETIGSSNFATAVAALNAPIYLRLSELPADSERADPVVNNGTLGTAGLGMTWGLADDGSTGDYTNTQPISGVASVGPDVIINGEPLVGLEDSNRAAQFIAGTTFTGEGSFNSRLLNCLSKVNAMDTENMTYSFFFKMPATQTFAYPRVITSHPSNSNRFDVCLNNGMLALVTNPSSSDTAENKAAGVPILYNDGEWHHLVAIRQGDLASNAKLYVDGVLQTLTSRDGSWSAGYGLRIGSRGNRADGWTGTMDEVAMWGRALTDTEVQGLYQAAISVPEPSTLALLLAMFVGGLACSRRRSS